MLKALIINGKKVPVPVPLNELSQALEWVLHNLVNKESTLTMVELDGKEQDLDALLSGESREVPLKAVSRLSLKIDSPIALAIQSVDAVRNLASITEPSLKPLAVNLWRIEGNVCEHHEELSQLRNDLILLCDLLGHIGELVASLEVDLSELYSSQDRLRKMELGMAAAISQSDWKGLARILLNQVERELTIIINAAVAVQNQLFQLKVNLRGATFRKPVVSPASRVK